MKEKARSYVRVSTLKESQKDSPEHQESAIKEHASRMDFDIEHVYEDRDTGTSIVARDEVQQMIEDAKRGECKTLFFSSLSRFSRDALDALSLKRVLVNALGVRVVSIEDNYDSGIDDNEMMFGMVSVMNQKQSEQIGIASRRGIRQSAAKGNFTGSIAPYGYKKVNVDGRKTLAVVPEQAEVVRTIYDLYTNHKMGEKAITKYLNGDNGKREAVPSYKGSTWGLTSVQRILMNEVYTGENVFGKHEVEKVYNDINNMHDRGKKQVMKNITKWERTPFKTHEAIISDELYKEAQDIRLIRGGGQRGGRKAYVNVFAKFVFCHHCGSAMVTMMGKSNEKYRYLFCSRRRRHGQAGCVNDKWIPYYPFRDEIIRMVTESMSPEVDSKEISENTKFTFLNQDLEKNMKRLRKTIDDNRKFLFELRKLNMLGEVDDAQYAYERKQYEGELSRSELSLAELSKKSDDQRDSEKLRKHIKENLDDLTSLDNYDDTDKLRIILMRLIERITIDSNGDTEVHTMLEKLG